MSDRGRGFMGALGIKMWVADGRTHGSCALRPDMWAPGTETVRMGVLVTLADIVGGSLPDGALNPTVDLQVSLLDEPPSLGTVYMSCETLKHGNRLYVGEVTMWTDSQDRPFGRSTVTFINRRVGDSPPRDWPEPEVDFDRFEDQLGARVIAPGVVELEPNPGIDNGVAGNIQGGVQAMLAELAAESAVAPGGRVATTDLDIRYLNRLKVGPLVARARVVRPDLDRPDVATEVRLTDAGYGERPLAFVTTLCHILPVDASLTAPKGP